MAKKAKAAGRKAATKKPAGKKPAKKAKAEAATVLDYVSEAANRLKRARVVFAHGASDSVAEAAFIVGETLGLHPDAIEDAASRRLTKADGVMIRELVEQRIRTRRPAAYLLNKI